MDSSPSPSATSSPATGQRAGLEIRFTAPRRGLATSARLKGHDQIVIAKQGGWAPHSKVLAGYLEIVDLWEENALHLRQDRGTEIERRVHLAVRVWEAGA
ncbi:hypothetical protein NRK68_34310 (plasmid) [Streptomyces yangpuensis]|uniref:Uncharacterized protein n=1 Tax=Streptomyces yangpuensis TaxID=1648182 RepID=A0ABY5Q7R5_9ACTN|nr:hypothetical protein [Streptomyces yangpuensis]UUY52349.1 hypothetical protein NRK68_34310 [Streptomyces yangpuensis]